MCTGLRRVGIKVIDAESIHRFCHLALERQAVHLAVCHNVQAGTLLPGDRPINGIIFYRFERGLRQVTGSQRPLSFEQLWGTQ